jgi:hypothetical protein
LTDYCSGSGEACLTDGDCAQGTCGVDGVIHLIDQGIVPSKNANQQAIYSVQVIEEACPKSVEDNYSTALVVTQSLWGDIANLAGCPLPIAGGGAGIVPDVTGALAKFSNNLCAPKKMRANVEPAEISAQVNITDVLQLLNAFSSNSTSYTFLAGPACAAGTKVAQRRVIRNR